MATKPLTQTTGRRKEAVARARLRQGTGQVTINGRPFDVYFPTAALTAGNTLFVRVRGEADAAARRLDAMFTGFLPGAVNQLHTMDEVLAAQIYPFRALYWISSALGGLALHSWRRYRAGVTALGRAAGNNGPAR